MTTAHLESMQQLTQARAEEYIHIAKSMAINQFGPATEHAHTDIIVSLATAMMQHEGAQIIADAFRVSS